MRDAIILNGVTYETRKAGGCEICDLKQWCSTRKFYPCNVFDCGCLRRQEPVFDTDLLIKTAARLCRTNAEVVISKSRRREASEARFLISRWLAAHKMTEGEIAKLLNRDRTTIVYSINKCADLLAADADFHTRWDRLNEAMGM